MNITGTDTELDEASDAFNAGHEFLGDLKPFSFRRQAAAYKMGMQFGRLSEEDLVRTPNPAFLRRQKAERALDRAKGEKKKALEKELADLANEPEELVTWDAMIEDAAIVLWLCKQKDSTVERVCRKPREYQRELDAWAEANGLGMGGDRNAEAIAAFSAILNAANASRGTPDIPGSETREEGPDPNG